MTIYVGLRVGLTTSGDDSHRQKSDNADQEIPEIVVAPHSYSRRHHSCRCRPSICTTGDSRQPLYSWSHLSKHSCQSNLQLPQSLCRPLEDLTYCPTPCR